MGNRGTRFGAGFLDPGERDRRVTIQTLTSTEDGGFPTETWADLVTVFASCEDQAASEAFRANQLSAKGMARWEIGYRADMDPETLAVPRIRRLVSRGGVYDIVSAALIGRKEGIELVTLMKAD